jgi:hypothetical protein
MIKTIVEVLFTYFDGCPFLADNRLNIDYLPEDTKKTGVEYSIGVTPTDEILKTYKDGVAHCRFPFVISSVNDYGPDADNNLRNFEFMENLKAWIREQARGRRLPALPRGMTARSIRALGPPYLYEPDAQTAKYQIQCELQYYRKGD